MRATTTFRAFPSLVLLLAAASATATPFSVAQGVRGADPVAAGAVVSHPDAEGLVLLRLDRAWKRPPELDDTIALRMPRRCDGADVVPGSAWIVFAVPDPVVPRAW